MLSAAAVDVRSHCRALWLWRVPSAACSLRDGRGGAPAPSWPPRPPHDLHYPRPLLPPRPPPSLSTPGAWTPTGQSAESCCSAKCCCVNPLAASPSGRRPGPPSSSPCFSFCGSSCCVLLLVSGGGGPGSGAPPPPDSLFFSLPLRQLNTMSSSRTADGGGESTWGATVWADDDEWEDVDAVAAVATTTAAAVAEPESTKEAVPPEGVSGSAPLPPPREGALPGEAMTRNEAGGGAGIRGWGLSRPPTVVVDDSVCRGGWASVSLLRGGWGAEGIVGRQWVRCCGLVGEQKGLCGCLGAAAVAWRRYALCFLCCCAYLVRDGYGRAAMLTVADAPLP